MLQPGQDGYVDLRGVVRHVQMPQIYQTKAGRRINKAMLMLVHPSFASTAVATTSVQAATLVLWGDKAGSVAACRPGDVVSVSCCETRRHHDTLSYASSHGSRVQRWPAQQGETRMPDQRVQALQAWARSQPWHPECRRAEDDDTQAMADATDNRVNQRLHVNQSAREADMTAELTGLQPRRQIALLRDATGSLLSLAIADATQQAWLAKLLAEQRPAKQRIVLRLRRVQLVVATHGSQCADVIQTPVSSVELEHENQQPEPQRKRILRATLDYAFSCTQPCCVDIAASVAAIWSTFDLTDPWMSAGKQRPQPVQIRQHLLRWACSRRECGRDCDVSAPGTSHCPHCRYAAAPAWHWKPLVLALAAPGRPRDRLGGITALQVTLSPRLMPRLFLGITAAQVSSDAYAVEAVTSVLYALVTRLTPRITWRLAVAVHRPAGDTPASQPGYGILRRFQLIDVDVAGHEDW